MSVLQFCPEMDLEQRDLVALEERLYSTIHHSYQDPQTSQEAAPLAPAARVVSRTSVINNGQGTLPANMKRYWAGSGAPIPSERTTYQKNRPPNDGVKQNASSDTIQASENESVTTGVGCGSRKMFLTPYQSLLGIANVRNPENESVQPESVVAQSAPPVQTMAPNMPPKESGLMVKKKKQSKQSSQSAVAALEKKLENLSKLVSKNRKEAAVQVMNSKKAKANKVRNRKKPPTVVAQITLNSSDEESRQEAPKLSKSSSPVPLLSDGDADEVIIVPVPSPPKICIDCSEEEDSQNTFALPKTRKSKKKKPGKFSSPRCLSPSNSSIMSDDFIGQHDRSRLNDSFTEPIPNDDELECSLEGSHRSGASTSKKNSPEGRQERVPSISSEDTVCTSGDTTDQEKRPEDATSPKTLPSLLHDKATKSKKKLKDGVEKTASKAKGSKSSGPAPTTESMLLSTDTEVGCKTPGKSKTRTNSPATLVSELVHKQFETKKSGKKSKSKKENDKNLGSSEQKEASTTSATKNNVETGGKQKVMKNSLSLVDENISSESDYDLLPLNTPSKASTPHKPNNKSIGTEKNRLGKRSASSSFFDEIGDMSSDSANDESLLHAKKDSEKQTVTGKESKKRIGRKRKQYNSETYSDEDFACLLTDIVRAVSDTDDDDEDEDTTLLEKTNEEIIKNPSITKPINEEKRLDQEQQQDVIATPVVRPKKKKKTKDVSTAADYEQILDDVQKTPRGDNAAVEPVKKKKKLKPGKSTAKQTGSDTIVPDFVVVVPELPNKKSKPSLSTKKMVKSTGSNNASMASVVQVIDDSGDDDDEDVTIVENRFSEPNRDVRKRATKPTVVGPECAWNEEMKLFYNDTWAEEDFNLKSVLNSMPRDRRQWHIVHKDLYPDPPKREVICNICDEPGHMKFKCRNKPKKPICYMCGEVGHKEPRCPKTICLNIEDNVPLKKDYVRNPKARWCCICCRYGHQAHDCNDAARIFGHTIPTTTINSYLPAYRGEYNRFRKHKVDEQQRRIAMDPTQQYNLFSSDANDCELNLDDVIQNENGFYYRFFKMTGLLERQNQLQMSKALEDVEEQQLTYPETNQDEPRAEKSTISADLSEVPVEPEVIDRLSHTDKILENESRTCDEDNGVNKTRNTSSDSNVVTAIIEENSNYSFSEFNVPDEKHSDKAINVLESAPERVHADSVDNPIECQTESGEQQQTLADFIPLASVPPVQKEPTAPVVIPAAEPIALDVRTKSPSETAVAPVELVTDARVFLSKEHAKLLLSPKGSEFLNDAGTRHTVKLSITFESVGNVLLITGRPELQDSFHQELVKFLNSSTQDETNAKYFQMFGPRVTGKMVDYISQHLRFLKANCSVTDLLAAYQQLSPDGNANAHEKCRRKLNIQLFGVYGLREGRKHLNVLRSQLSQCMKGCHWKQLLSQKQRSIIDDAIRYIFSAYDHKDYVEIVKEYEILRETHQLRMLTYNDLGLQPKGNNTGTRRKNRNAAHQNNMSKNFHIDVNICSRKKMFDEEPTSFNGDDNFVLNTFDQMIDPIRLQQLDDTTRSVSYDQQWNEFSNGDDGAYGGGSQHDADFSSPPLPGSHSNWTNNEPSDDWEDMGYRTPKPRDRFHWYGPQNQQGNSAPDGNGEGGNNSSYFEIARLNERDNALHEQQWYQLEKLRQMLQQ
uniref:Zinc finger CCHC domain-containing protein 7 n=1 Tax=Anopheles farauti TaxID=69004 RepID=A0A182QKC1_9DIPT